MAMTTKTASMVKVVVKGDKDTTTVTEGVLGERAIPVSNLSSIEEAK
jgi:hypothetical protein